MDEPIFAFREQVLCTSIRQKWDWRFGSSSIRRYLHIDVAALRSLRAARIAYEEGTNRGQTTGSAAHSAAAH